jgi:tetratricopeptide (TPR) repeat protein/CHAT domain-containing protein
MDVEESSESTANKQRLSLATNMTNLAMRHYAAGNYPAAASLCKQALDIKRIILGEQHPSLAASLNNLAMIYKTIGNYAAAEPLYKQALRMHRQMLGEQHQDVADILDNLASLYSALGNYAAAEPLCKQALEIYRARLGEQHPDFAICLNNLALLYLSMRNYTAAEPLFKQTLEIIRQVVGEQHLDFAVSLDNLAGLYCAMENYVAAEPLYKQASEIFRNTQGERHPDFATNLNGLALLYHAMGNYVAAEPLFKQALEINRDVLGEAHPKFATSLNNLALLYGSVGNYVAAEPLLKWALEITRQVVGGQHPAFAASLYNLAKVYVGLGDYASAEPLGKQATEVLRQSLGEQHPRFAASLDSLALLYKSMGNYVAAEPLFKQALEINRDVLGEAHPKFAINLNNLAMLYCVIGNYAAAEPLLKQALEIHRQAVGEQHSDFAISLSNLAFLHNQQGNYAAAAPLLRRALEIKRVVLGEQHRSYATSLNNLAFLCKAVGDYETAESLFKQALEILREALGEQHPNFASNLSNLAGLYCSMGDYAAAEPFSKQALKIRRKVVGEQHSDFALSLSNLANILVATGRETEAEVLEEQALTIRIKIIGQVFSISSENQRSAYFKTIRGNFYAFLSLIHYYRRDSPEAVRSLLSHVLRLKAIEAEALAIQRDAVLGGKYPKVALKLREITMLRAQIAQKILSGPGKEGLQTHQQLLDEWSAQKERFEAEVARQIPEMNLEQKLRSIDHQIVAMALPEGTTLVEFVCFDVFDFKAVPANKEPQWKPARYIAFVMPAGEPDNVQMIDLGEAPPIDQMIATFRETITGEAEDGSNRGLGALPSSARCVTGEGIGIQLREAIFTPLLKAIGKRKRLMISPDGDLTRLPFEVLPTDNGRRLIDEYQMSYLGAGRDVIRFEFKSNRKPSRSLVTANPDFDLCTKAMRAKTTASTGRRSRDFKRDEMDTFASLPGTRVEGENIAAMLDAELLTDSEALDARLKNCKSPRILHLATHGFFLEDQKRDPNEDHLGLGVTSFSESEMERLTSSRFENPLLRSGLALAGVNTWLRQGELMEEAEDGLLTAEDVTGLDLLDTELVVLSACETGLGEVRIGEGVFGLRRAFVLAGAKTLVMSLWKVPDGQTRELMEDFYRRILAGEPRADALREAQLAMKAKHSEPLYWGAFICQGDPGPLT